MPNDTIEDVKTILISNSELDTEQKCDFRAYLSYGEEIRRKDLGEALNRGLFGHDIFEIYFKARLEGKSHEEANQEMYAFMIPKTLEIQNPNITNVHRQIQAAIEWFNDLGYVPVEVEEVKKYEIPGVFEHPIYGKYRLVFCLTPDVILRGTKKDYDKDELIVTDYKFTGQFWNPEKIRLYQQIPKYIKFLNDFDNYGIKRGLLMQLNTRLNASDKAQLFVPKWISPTNVALDRFYQENLVLMKKFAERKLQSLQEWKDTATRTINTNDCAWCPFSADLCPQLLEGRNVETTLKAFYEHNDYGYTP